MDFVTDRLSDKTIRIFWIFVLSSAVFWTFMPPLIFAFYRPDTAEMMMVGKHWLLASYKHPAMQGWIVEILSNFTGRAEFTPYLASQLAVILTVWCVWKLAREYLTPPLALAAALSLLTYIYFNYESTLYNNRTFMRAFEALAIYWLYCAFQYNKLRYWVGTGAALAAGIYGNFATFLLVLGIVAFMLVDSNARKYWRSPGPYVTTGVCFLLFIPLLVWLFRHDFALISYAQNGLTGCVSFRGHFCWPIRFAGSQILLFFPILIALLPLTGIGWKWNVPHLWGKSTKDRFLTFFILFPFLLTLLISAGNGHKIRGALGCQIWILLPIFILYTAQNLRETPEAVRRSLTVTAGIMILFASLAVGMVHYSPLIQNRSARMHYPAQKIAAEVTRIWNEHYSTPLKYVRGDDWPAMALVFYGSSHPDEYSPLWSDDADFRKHGGVLIWQEKAGKTEFRMQNHFANTDFSYVPETSAPLEEWLAEFPNRIALPSLEFEPETSFPVEKVRVGMALVPPEN